MKTIQRSFLLLFVLVVMFNIELETKYSYNLFIAERLKSLLRVQAKEDRQYRCQQVVAESRTVLSSFPKRVHEVKIKLLIKNFFND